MTPSNAGSSLEALLTCPQNLYWAWLKYQRYMQSVHTWIDDYRLSCFEANLQAELDAIARQFKRLTYRTEPIRPLPLPSHAGKNNAQGGLIYDISVRDQVAWIAFLNVIGPGLDAQMPPWSYVGNPLSHSPFLNIKNMKPLFASVYRNFAKTQMKPLQHIKAFSQCPDRMAGLSQNDGSRV